MQNTGSELACSSRGTVGRYARAMLPFVFALLMVISGTSAYAQGNFGFGLIIGEPTGLAWKYKINHLNAVDGAIGFSPYDRFRMHVDYLWSSHPFNDEHLSIHYGLGAAVGFGGEQYFVRRGDTYFLRDTELGFGARVVAGLTYEIPRSPVDLFFEMAPLIIAAPGPGFGIDIGLGARVYP